MHEFQIGPGPNICAFDRTLILPLIFVVESKLHVWTWLFNCITVSAHIIAEQYEFFVYRHKQGNAEITVSVAILPNVSIRHISNVIGFV